MVTENLLDANLFGLWLSPQPGAEYMHCMDLLVYAKVEV
jgi:hypothetical protein